MSINDNIEYILNGELVRRLLIRYFCEKGFSENFDLRVYPPLLQDISEAIPELIGKIELIPFAIDINPNNGSAKLGWNLFIFGNQRMYLGETDHINLANLARQVESENYVIDSDGEAVGRQMRSARDIVNWISRVSAKDKSGLISAVDQQAISQKMPILKKASGQVPGVYDRPKSTRPEGGTRH